MNKKEKYLKRYRNRNVVKRSKYANRTKNGRYHGNGDLVKLQDRYLKDIIKYEAARDFVYYNSSVPLALKTYKVSSKDPKKHLTNLRLWYRLAVKVADKGIALEKQAKEFRQHIRNLKYVKNFSH